MICLIDGGFTIRSALNILINQVKNPKIKNECVCISCSSLHNNVKIIKIMIMIMIMILIMSTIMIMIKTMSMKMSIILIMSMSMTMSMTMTIIKTMLIVKIKIKIKIKLDLYIYLVKNIKGVNLTARKILITKFLLMTMEVYNHVLYYC